MRIFTDTSGLYALMDADDGNHERAKAAWFSWNEQGEEFVCSNYVLLETMALIQRRLGMPAARLFHDGIVPVLDVQWVDQAVHASALSALFTAGKRELGLVDCTSFELMRLWGLQTVFGFDPHFKEQGFDCLPL